MAIHPNILTWRMDRGAWRAIVHGVAKSLIRLSDSHYFFFFFLISIFGCAWFSLLLRISLAMVGGGCSLAMHRLLLWSTGSRI